MRDANQHILFVATEYATGMRHYASAIIHAMWQAGDYVLIVIKDQSLKQDMADIPQDAVTWIDYPTGKIPKARFRFRPTSVVNAIEDIVKRHGITLIYSLTEELILANCIKRLQRNTPMLYTVHDAIHHDIKFNHDFTHRLKDWLLIAKPQRKMLNKARHIVTNSHAQEEHLRQQFPDRDVYYAPFPSLVNDDIQRGGQAVPELSGVDDGYILFFGNLVLYKGVHLLYEAYLNTPQLRSRRLVIAGGGSIYFERRADDEAQGVTFIHRFIDDKELSDLFTRAGVVVYPYISATQSGVVSVASYFDKPMVLSDLPYFRQACSDHDGIEFFPAGDSNALADAITRLQQSPASTRAIYDEAYSPQAMSAALNRVFDAVIG